MTYEEFQEYVRAECLYETIYSDSDGREILIIRMLDAYAMMMEFKPEKSLQEPVAWMYDQATYYEGDLRGRCWIPTLSRQDPKYPAMTRNVVALFAAPKEVD
jgi:hypothetical protein